MPTFGTGSDDRSIRYTENPMARPKRWLQFSLRTLLIFALVAALAFGWLVELRRRAHFQMVEEAIKKVNAAEDLPTASLHYRELFAIVGKNGLQRLQRSQDDSIAIQSAWEAVKLTVPELKGTEVRRPNKEKLAWFVELVATRSGTTVPEWWAEVIQDARAHPQGNIYPGKPSKSPYHKSGFQFVNKPLSLFKQVNVPIGTTVGADDRRITLESRDDSITIPRELVVLHDYGFLLNEDLSSVDNMISSVNNVSAAFTKDRCFIVLHDTLRNEPVVASVDRTTGNVVWKNRACGCLFFGFNSGERFHGWVSVIVHDDRVVVFGKASSAIYAHGFQRDSP